MKRLLPLFLFMSLLSAVQAQKPSWTRTLPKAANNTYIYVCESAIASTPNDAVNQAMARVMQTTAFRLGQPFDSQKINKALQKGTDFEVISRQYNIPIFKICQYEEKVEANYRVYVLCQAAVTGNVSPLFDNSFHACSDIRDYSNGMALLKSFFVPGLGQIGKRHISEGVITLVAEVALVGAGTGCYFIAKDKLTTMQNPATSYDDFVQAQNTYNTLRTTSHIAWSAAGAVYIFNLFRAFFEEPNYKESLSFTPSLIQTNQSLTPALNLTLHF